MSAIKLNKASAAGSLRSEEEGCRVADVEPRFVAARPVALVVAFCLFAVACPEQEFFLKISGSESAVCEFYANLRRDSGKPAGSLRLLSLGPTESRSMYLVFVAGRRSAAHPRQPGKCARQSAILASDGEEAVADLESGRSSDRCSNAPLRYRYAAGTALSEVRRD